MPTLIDCELLKIASLNRSPFATTWTTPAHRLALLLKQQRSEIMQRLSYIVNWFFLASLKTRRPRRAALLRLSKRMRIVGEAAEHDKPVTRVFLSSARRRQDGVKRYCPRHCGVAGVARMNVVAAVEFRTQPLRVRPIAQRPIEVDHTVEGTA